ncbi:hypothetical protein NECAME_08089 [Necator americanus]|uniref:Uncharacterized protein n=1 Tax=Necator americanus TaxID=51031 RepID=W2TJE1_NECAM|nr:hypothetical protein NECAME_08089 [Necator americanus]ETN82215.1 hypothetical protein NECAME_08089 [Necator americanus]
MSDLSLLAILVILVTVDGAEVEQTCSKAKPCAPGVILPVWQPQTDLQECTIIFRAIIYLIALFYMFFGVSIVADR